MSGRMYRIGEAAALLGLKSYVLRFWETEFPQLEPVRTERGQRLYTEEHIDLLRLIRHLLHERGLTIDGARRILNSPDSRKALREDALSTVSELSPELFEYKPGVEPDAGDDRLGGEEFNNSRFDDELDATAVEFISGWLSFLDEVTEELAEIRELLAPLGDDWNESACRDEYQVCAAGMSVEAGEPYSDTDGAGPFGGGTEAAAAAVGDSDITVAEYGEDDRVGDSTSGKEAFTAVDVLASAQEGEPGHGSHGNREETVSQGEVETMPANSDVVSGSMFAHDASSGTAGTMSGSAGGTTDFFTSGKTTGLLDITAADTTDYISSDSSLASDDNHLIKDNLEVVGCGPVFSADCPDVAFTEADKAVIPGNDPACGTTETPAPGNAAATSLQRQPRTEQSRAEQTRSDPQANLSSAPAFVVETGSISEENEPMHGFASVAHNVGPTPIDLGSPAPQAAQSAEPASLPERIAAWEISLAGLSVSDSGSVPVNPVGSPAQESGEPAVNSDCAFVSTVDKNNLAFSPESKGDEGDFSFSPAEAVLTPPVESSPDCNVETASAFVKADKTEVETGNTPEFVPCSDSLGEFKAASAFEAAFPTSLSDYPGPSVNSTSNTDWLAAGTESSGTEVSKLQENDLLVKDEDDDMETFEFEFSPVPDVERK